MSNLEITIYVVAGIGVLGFFGTLLVYFISMWVVKRKIGEIASLANSEKPCYRCAGVATTEYMSLPYCTWCQAAVVAMYPAVHHDPPYGFPGGSGYLDFPEKEKEKEISA